MHFEIPTKQKEYIGQYLDLGYIFFVDGEKVSTESITKGSDSHCAGARMSYGVAARCIQVA